MLVTQVWGQTGLPTWAQMTDGSGLYMMLFYFWQLVKNYPEPGINSSVNWFQNASRLVNISILTCQYQNTAKQPSFHAPAGHSWAL